MDNSKAKDPHGHINELYKYMGHDDKKSLLLMMNQIKRELIIPTKFDLSDITVLFKNKGSRQEVEN